MFTAILFTAIFLLLFYVILEQLVSWINGYRIRKTEKGRIKIEKQKLTISRLEAENRKLELLIEQNWDDDWKKQMTSGRNR